MSAVVDWPGDLCRREASADSKPFDVSRVEALFALPEFWKGAAASRAELNAGAGMCGAILAGLAAGKQLGDIAAFAEWRR